VRGHGNVEAVGPHVCGISVGPADLEAERLLVPVGASIQVGDGQVNMFHPAHDGT
jgi:hypothetical protein